MYGDFVRKLWDFHLNYVCLWNVNIDPNIDASISNRVCYTHRYSLRHRWLIGLMPCRLYRRVVHGLRRKSPDMASIYCPMTLCFAPSLTSMRLWWGTTLVLHYHGDILLIYCHYILRSMEQSYHSRLRVNSATFPPTPNLRLGSTLEAPLRHLRLQRGGRKAPLKWQITNRSPLWRPPFWRQNYIQSRETNAISPRRLRGATLNTALAAFCSFNQCHVTRFHLREISQFDSLVLRTKRHNFCIPTQ